MALRRNPLTPRLLSGPAFLLPGLALLLAASGCQPPADSEVPAAVLPDRGPVPIVVSSDPWVLSTESWEGGYRGTYLGNGYLGQRLMQAGTGNTGAEPEQAFIAGLYLKESLVILPPLVPLRITRGDAVYSADPKQVTRYRQELRLREGTLVTSADWNAGGTAKIELTYAPLRQQPDLVVLRGRIENGGGSDVTLALDSVGAAVGSEDRLVRDAYGARLTSAIASGSGTGGKSVTVPAGQTVEFAAVTHARGGLMKPENALPDLPEVTVEQADRWLEEHRKAWDRLWATDIEIEGDPEAQQVTRTCLFYVLQSIRPDSDAGVPPMGLSAQAFAGHVFWDMDSWMLPAVLPLHPELARAMLEYRFRTLPGARANARKEGLPGASYAWESGATGTETIGGAVFSYGRHVSGDVALALKQYYQATGDREWLRSRAWPVLQATADNWAARAEKAPGGGYVVKDVTTPDENAGQVDHSAWTHHVARVNLEFAAETARALGQPANPKWETVARGLSFLRDPQTKLILPYQGFTEKTKAKQADVMLLAHPGEMELSRDELGRMYDYYVPRVIPNGPAMTDAIHAIAAARLERGEEALDRFRKSYQPFVRPPFHVFSEKRSRDNLCFLTGASGVVEAVLYGFAGMRPESDPDQVDRPSLQPHLPAGWTTLRLKGLQWRGKRWNVELKPGAAPAWSPG